MSIAQELAPFGLDDIRQAEWRSQQMGVLRNSFCRGKGNVVGFIGEIVLNKYLNNIGFYSTIEDKLDYDLVAGSKRRKLEVKTTKTSVPPEDHYDNAVNDANARQQADYYVFLRLQWNPDHTGGTIYFCGAVSPVPFRMNAQYTRKGQPFTNGRMCRSTCWILPMFKCMGLGRLLEDIQVSSDAHAHAMQEADPDEEDDTDWRPNETNHQARYSPGHCFHGHVW